LADVILGQEHLENSPGPGNLDSLNFEMSADSSNFEFGPDSTDLEFTVDTTFADTVAMDESLTLDSVTVAQDSTAQDARDALEAFLAEEELVAELGAQLIGYTAGLDLGYPIYRYGGLGNNYNQSGPAFGITVNTPFGAQLGSFELGFGMQIGNYSFKSTERDEKLAGVYILGTANTSVYQTPNGTVSTQVGAGYFGKSIGITAGFAFDYALPNYPLVIRPYIRANGTLDSGVQTNSKDTPSYLWINYGIMNSYDLSLLYHQITQSQFYDKLATKIGSLFQ